ncbi:hypothetical protein [Aeromicrobium sp. Root472D3]|uniref:hypothetical protein n=1 Tax=Aeromicrobium sp. Root472D3 TaxID=1736540 RepID=UPI0007003BD7|nr:hypothetical protein [Aeromicrobium sp. Root472D3]KQX74503.1 hypothetical protein ASD10_04510 [Aeromicrobium sp. Root472D3]
MIEFNRGWSSEGPPPSRKESAVYAVLCALFGAVMIGFAVSATMDGAKGRVAISLACAAMFLVQVPYFTTQAAAPAQPEDPKPDA